MTILNWSFPRKDIPRSRQASQIALALRGEVADLETAGCRIIQVDEPALREGLPLKHARWEGYLDWSVAAFRLAVAGAAPATQIVTHLCYSSFEDILPAIDGLDADVLTIENSRSDNEMVCALAAAGYGRDVGPGVYDVHSPVVPTIQFLVDKLRSFAQVRPTREQACLPRGGGVVGRFCTAPRRLWKGNLPDCDGFQRRRSRPIAPLAFCRQTSPPPPARAPSPPPPPSPPRAQTNILGGDATRIWVNPDCGLKTRRWEEVIPALRNMVTAAATVRAEVEAGQRVAPSAAAKTAAPAQPAHACHTGCH